MKTDIYFQSNEFIRNVKPGFCTVMRWYPLMDENFLSGVTSKEEYENKVNEQKSKSVLVPVVVTKVNKVSDYRAPSDTNFDIAIMNRMSSFEIGGYNIMQEVPLWRYWDLSVEPPKWMFDGLASEAFRVHVSELYYAQNVQENTATLVYPLKG